MNHYTELSPSAQAAYAQLLDATQASELARSVATLRGSFARKKVKGRTYWYFQYTEVSGVLRQLYVGPDSDRVRTLIEHHREGGPTTALEPLARSAIVLGCSATLPIQFRVMRRLADYGFFKAGGVLVGTHAFLAFGNMLGVRWGDASRTQDVDFAHAGKQLAIALPTNLQVDTHAAIESLEIGLLPIADLDGGMGSTYLSPRDPDFQIDFLTPLHRGGTAPFLHPQLGVKLQPLKFMEYLLEDVQQAAVMGNEGAVLATVPHPCRYALHKLMVHGERPLAKAVKANKDLRQAAALLDWCRTRFELDLREAWTDLVRRGPGWSTRAIRGRDALARTAPDLDFRELLPAPRVKHRKG